MNNNVEHLSYSKIRTYEECKLKYFYNYIYKIRIFDYNFYNVLGILTHFFIERMIENNLTYKDIYKEYGNNIENLKEDLYLKNFNDEQILTYSEEDISVDSIDDNITNKIEGLFKELEKHNKIPLYQAFKFVKQSEVYIDKLKKYFPTLVSEIEFLYLKKNITYQGIIDILGAKDKEIKIIDIKTSKTDTFLSKKQLMLYAYLYVKTNNIKLKEYDIKLEFFNVRNLSIKRYNLKQTALNKFSKWLDYITTDILNFNKKYSPLIDNSDKYEIMNNIKNKSKINLKPKNKEVVDNIINDNYKHFLTLDKSACTFCNYKDICSIYSTKK